MLSLLIIIWTTYKSRLGKLFKTQREDTLINHQIEIHGRERLYDGATCLICNKEYTVKKIRRHIRKVHKVDPTTGRDITHEWDEETYCDHCQKNLNDKSQLWNHMKQVHEENFICDICEAPYTGNHCGIRHDIYY